METSYFPNHSVLARSWHVSGTAVAHWYPDQLSKARGTEDSMAGRRGFGSIRKLPSGRYQARYTVLDRGVFTAPTTFQTKRDADAWLSREQTRLNDENWTPPKEAHAAKIDKATKIFSEYATEALERRTLSARSKYLYQNMLDKFILPKFGQSTLASITTPAVSNWWGSMKNSPSQQQLAYTLFKSIMNDALNDGLIDKNPCLVRKASKKKKQTEPDILSPEEFRTYVAAIPEKHQMLFKLTFWCGLRSGEVRALRRSDINLVKGTLTVSRSLVRVSGKNLTEKPKTQAGNRTITLPAGLVKELKPWLMARPEGLLFTNIAGEELSSQYLSSLHAKGRTAINKPKLTFHGLRHSAATLLAQNGASTKELMDKFGWNTPAMAAHYTHSTEQRQQELAEKLSALM